MYTQNYSHPAELGKQEYDIGLREYILSIYNYMFGALLFTAFMGYASLNTPLFNLLYSVSPSGHLGMSGLGLIINFVPLVISLGFGFKLHTMQTSTAQMLFWAFAGAMGMSLSSLGIIYTGVSIIRAFLITACVFGAMSIYGYTTKKDLTNVGAFLMMALLGVIITSFVNMFLKSSGMHFLTSLISVFIFIGLIAYDTQKLKSIYYQVGGGETGKKMAVMGALSLYLDFINLFVSLLRVMGDRKN